MSDISEKDIKTLIAQAAEELGALLKSEPVEKAYTSEGGEANPTNVDVSDEKPTDATPDMQSDPSEAAPEFEGSGSDSGSSSSSSDSSSSSSSSDSSSSSSDSSAEIDDSASEEELEEAYCKLSDEDLRAHYEAVKKAVFQRMGGQGDAGMGGEVMDAAPAAPPAAPAPAPEAPLAQSEKEINMMKNANSGGITIEKEKPLNDHSGDPTGAPDKSAVEKDEESMSKRSGSPSEEVSETKSDLGKDEIEAEVGRDGVGSKSNPVKPGGTGRLETIGKSKGAGSKDRLVEIGKSELDELKETVETLAKALDLMLNVPSRKAVTSLPEFRLNSPVLKKSEMPDISNLTKSEIHTKLVELTKSDGLSVSERDRITNYYVGSLKAEDIADIISKK